MAVADGSTPPPGLPSQQYPPPLLPKPGKDNARLQKLLKRTGKKKPCAPTSQSTVPFRSSLSPVNEASPDLERSDNSTPPRAPEMPFTLHSIQPAPRFAVRTLYQHIASPYPQRAAYSRTLPTSPQLAATPSPYMQDASTSSSLSVSPSPGQLAVPRIVPPEVAVAPTSQIKKPVSLCESPAGLEPAPVRANSQPKPKSPGPTPYSTAGGQALIRPVTVLVPIIKSKSPRPTFRATELSRSPKPLFDVPQIRMYTASTSYYETSRTPPVFDTAALTAIGSMVPSSKAPAETKQDEVGREATSWSSSSITDSPRKAATSHTPTSGEIIAPNRETLTPDICRASPTPGDKRATQTAENKRATPTANSRATPTSDMEPVAPSSEMPAKTHTYEFETSRLTAVRPPARAATPVFEVPRPNPLLFAVTPIDVEVQRSSVSQTRSDANSSSGYQGVKKFQIPSELLNREIHSDAEKPEPDLTRVPPPSAVTTSQRPKTPTYEASRLLSTSPSYKRPKTPTCGIPHSAVSPVAFQQPKTPTHTTQKSSYRGLTPAEYAAYGGIRTYSPAFGISSTTTQTQEGVNLPARSEKPSPRASVPMGSAMEGSKTKDEDEFQQVEEKGAVIPAIVVSQYSEKNGTKETRPLQVAARQETSWTEETPKAVVLSAESQTSIQQTTQSSQTEVRTKVTEGKRPEAEEQDHLKAQKKLPDKEKVQTTEQEPEKQKKVELLKQKEPFAATATTSKNSPAGLQLVVQTKLLGGTEAVSAVSPASVKKELEDPPAAELLLKVLQKPKGIKSKSSGWSRLKKHMVVEQEEPKFPELEPHKQAGQLGKPQVHLQDHKMADDEVHAQDNRRTSGSPKATKMWDAVLFQMFSSKENIMHQIELSKSETEPSKAKPTDATQDIPSFAYHLPVLLFSPKFDAKKLKEAASRPVTKISTVFEMGLIGRKGKEEEQKDFNRTARGFRNV